MSEQQTHPLWWEYNCLADAEFADLKGKVLASVEQVGNEAVIFTCTTGERYVMLHEWDCCESVEIEDVCGEWDDLIGEEILVAEESSNNTDPPRDQDYNDDSYTWTFYHLRTMTGAVTLRWYGTSNGYYSERVSFGRMIDGPA